MNRMQRAVVLLSLLEQLRARGSWCGETHLQKATYFAQELLGVPLGFDFVLYKHGPFSFDLSGEISALRADLLMTVQSRSPYGPSILPGEGSKALLERYPQTRGRYAKQLQFVAERLGNKNVADLEKLATALYVTRDPSVSGAVGNRAEIIHRLKPHVPLEEAQAAVRQLDSIITDAHEFVVSSTPPR